MNLTAWAQRQPDKAAAIGPDGSISYAELERRSNQVAHVLRDLGLAAGDHLAIVSENRADVLPLVWAAQRTGLLYTLVNWHLTADEARYIVENCEARVLVASAGVADIAAALGSGLARVERRLSFGGPVEGYESIEQLADAASSSPVEDESEGYYMLYSSGTTGRPKGILPALASNPFGTGLTIDHTMADHFGFNAESVYLSPGPLYHAAPLGWTLGTIRNGGTAVLMDRFDAEDVLRLVERHRVTHAQFVPTMFVRMLKLDASVRRAYDLSSLRLVVHAAAPCPVEVKRQMIEWLGPIVVEFYSGSEGVCFFMIDSASWLERPGSVGRSLRGSVHITDEDGTELPPGEIGQIWFGEVTPFAYHGDPDKTRAAYDAHGWVTLGDLGHLDEDGFLYLSDRRTDLIVSGGVNVYPREIEDALILHPAVADVAVVGLPDPEFGQRVHAVVAVADGAVPDAELEHRLAADLRTRIAGFKMPRSWSFGDVPRLPSGKILRRVLMERFAAANEGRGL